MRNNIPKPIRDDIKRRPKKYAMLQMTALLSRTMTTSQLKQEAVKQYVKNNF